mmetsp:Transcript_26895/g.82544  ORF Transcript_26895/g.82544 Transcript_26895/m.82544 type:complete len:107 (+) Transcript_26895:194-514(+)
MPEAARRKKKRGLSAAWKKKEGLFRVVRLSQTTTVEEEEEEEAKDRTGQGEKEGKELAAEAAEDDLAGDLFDEEGEVQDEHHAAELFGHVPLRAGDGGDDEEDHEQ